MITTTNFLPQMADLANGHNVRWQQLRRERELSDAALMSEIDIRQTTSGALAKIRQKRDEAELLTLRQALTEAETVRDTLAALDELGRELVAAADAEAAEIVEARRAALQSAGVAKQELARATETAPDVVSAKAKLKQAREARASVYRAPNPSKEQAEQLVIDAQNLLTEYVSGRTAIALPILTRPTPTSPLRREVLHGQWRVNGVPVVSRKAEPVIVFASPDGE